MQPWATRRRKPVRGDSDLLPGGLWEHVFTGNIAQAPGLPLTGMRPVEAFMPDADDPLVDIGDSLWGMQSAFAGANRDIGAYERDFPPWNVGPGAKERAVVTLYDQAGRCVTRATKTVNAENVRVDLGKHAAGVYLAQWQVGTAGGACTVVP